MKRIFFFKGGIENDGEYFFGKNEVQNMERIFF